MNIFGFILRSIVFYWRRNVGLLLTAVVSGAVLAGALLVGDSVRYSLNRIVDLRLGSTELAQLDSEIESALSQVATRSFIQWHPAWDYFADDYGLKIIGTLEQGHGDEPSVKDMNDLVRKGRRGDVKTIIIGLGVESKAAQALAREISGRIVRLDTMGDPENPKKSSYIAMMKDNVRLLAAALNEDENQNE